MDLADQASEPASEHLGGAGRTFPVAVVALARDSQQAAAGVNWCSGVGQVDRSPGAPFWDDSSLLVEPRGRTAEDRDLMFELPDAPASCAQHGGFSTAEAWSDAVIDFVLAQPVVEGD